jgi:hypothetical protein
MRRTSQLKAGNEVDQVGNENDANAEEPNKKERDKKKRKLMIGLKKWTGMADEGERKFKRWSDNGHTRPLWNTP